MVRMRHKLFFPLLANTILALASVSTISPSCCARVLTTYGAASFTNQDYSTEPSPWNPLSLKFKFLAEARRLWEVEQSTDRLTTIQADVTPNVVLDLCGVDQIGWAYAEHANRMGERLGIFDGTHNFKSRRMREAVDFPAWVAFIWSAYVEPACCRDLGRWNSC